MKPKQVIEVLTQERNYWKRKYEMHKNNPSPIIREPYKRKVESLDHAINCVGAIEQIKWERDIAIQQLNELGYQFGEKVEKKTWTEILKNKGYLFEDETIPQALIKLAKALAILVGGAVFIGTVIGLILR